jgi:hypothetical protein
MNVLRRQQQLARILLVHGVSAEIRFDPRDGFAIVLDDPRQLVAVTALIAKYLPGAARVGFDPAQGA